MVGTTKHWKVEKKSNEKSGVADVQVRLPLGFPVSRFRATIIWMEVPLFCYSDSQPRMSF